MLPKPDRIPFIEPWPDAFKLGEGSVRCRGVEMTYRVRSSRIIAALSIPIFLNVCGQNHTEWQGTIEYIDGITVVKNPAEPYYGEFEAVLEEDLSVGNENDDNYRFFRVRGIALGSEDSIYVADMGNCRIQKFNKMGQYLQTIGRKGQGPGEFQGPLGICVDDQNTLYVPEYKRIHIFNRLGEYQRSYSLDYHPVQFAVESHGHIVGYCDLHQRDTARRGIVKMDSEGKLEQIFAEYTDLGIKIVIGKNATFTLSPNHVYSPRLVFTPVARNIFAYGYSSEYLIHIIDNEGNQLLRIRKSGAPIPITKKEKDFIIDMAAETLEQRQIPISKQMVDETMHFDKNRAFYNRILTDDKRRLYVQRVRGVFDENDEFEFDIFSADGRYLYIVRFPYFPEILKNGYLYCTHTDEDDGDVFIKRYGIKNWDQIKTGIN